MFYSEALLLYVGESVDSCMDRSICDQTNSIVIVLVGHGC